MILSGLFAHQKSLFTLFLSWYPFAAAPQHVGGSELAISVVLGTIVWVLDDVARHMAIHWQANLKLNHCCSCKVVVNKFKFK